jgi:hypothetical protein
MTPPQEESDQLPEEQPSGAVPDDTSEGTRDEAEGSAGAADDDGDEGEGQATGNPTNAG